MCKCVCVTACTCMHMCVCVCVCVCVFTKYNCIIFAPTVSPGLVSDPIPITVTIAQSGRVNSLLVLCINLMIVNSSQSSSH